jgi:CheY-like chemotaxis protein
MAKFLKSPEEAGSMFLFCSCGVKPVDRGKLSISRSSVEGRRRKAEWGGVQAEARGGNENNFWRLSDVRMGVRRMGLVEPRRPVVLIVEDEFLLRMDAVDMIKAAGFEAVEAGNADDAIDILEARPDITVVFTDIQMPGSMDGLKLVQAVRGRWPPIKIVATSGRVDVRESDLPEGGRFIPKPYSPNEITGVLRELTGGA